MDWRIALVLPLLLGAAPAPEQTVLDKVLSNVNGDIVTQLDVRQARMLKLRLVTAPADTDADVLRGLENRRLVLAEVNHVALPPPTAPEIAARRREWQASFAPSTDLNTLLDHAGLNEQGLTAWLRDDVRIESYLGQRFGGVPDADRPAEIARWLVTLREHAGLAKFSALNPLATCSPGGLATSVPAGPCSARRSSRSSCPAAAPCSRPPDSGTGRAA